MGKETIIIHERSVPDGCSSDVEPLPNGNRLITEVGFGLWEVTEKGKVGWTFSGQGYF